MKDNLTRRAALGAVGTAGLAALGAVALVPSKAAAAAKHPHLHAAIEELRAARTELNDAPDTFGGHKEEAIKQIDRAIEQIKVCIDNE